ncbi:hypothetical protein EVA_20839 [gut metagenome]|uniref:Uncharacterized protein n=1 Tax=gut metagenome TaxID=749906 RepID=J9FUP5_9ZZZZ
MAAAGAPSVCSERSFAATVTFRSSVEIPACFISNSNL